MITLAAVCGQLVLPPSQTCELLQLAFEHYFVVRATLSPTPITLSLRPERWETSPARPDRSCARAERRGTRYAQSFASKSLPFHWRLRSFNRSVSPFLVGGSRLEPVGAAAARSARRAPQQPSRGLGDRSDGRRGRLWLQVEGADHPFGPMSTPCWKPPRPSAFFRSMQAASLSSRRNSRSLAERATCCAASMTIELQPAGKSK